MKLLNEEELTKISASGGIGVAIAIGIAAAVVFVVGIIDGFVNPNACN